MRVSTTTAWLLTLGGLPFSSAFNVAKQRKVKVMADKGLFPDGTPKDQSSEALALRQKREEELPEIPEEYVTIPLNHWPEDGNYSCDGYFENRFWVYEDSYKKGGPVFLYDIGESDAEDYLEGTLQEEDSFIRNLIDQYNGIGILWEHRYYGNSTPVPINDKTPPEDFKWLTSEQALADVDYFAKQFKRENIKQDLTPDGTPWIFIGGSYPGMRAAFARDQYPETIYAALASSAPVQAQIDMSLYNDAIWWGMHNYGFGNCSRDVQAAIRYVDNALEKRPKEAKRLKELFLGEGSGDASNEVLASWLNQVFFDWQSYGMDGDSFSLRDFCDWISVNDDGVSSRPQGWAKSYGAEYTISVWAAYQPWIDMMNDTTEAEEDPASISWAWQYCTQWGYFHAANVGPQQLVSKYYSLEFLHDSCHETFPGKALPDWPQVNKTNEVFGGWDIRPSNTFWTVGEFDPWRGLSPLTNEPWAPQPFAFTDPPKCGKEQSSDEIFGYVVPDAEHVYEFDIGSQPFDDVMFYFQSALDEWLPCFTPAKNRIRGLGRS